MSTPAMAASGGKSIRRSVVIIEDRARIPPWVDDLESYRLWARSEEFPERGWFSFLNGELWVDLSMEEFFTHNQVKAAFTLAILSLLQKTPLGRFVPDRMLLTNVAADLSTEPDGLFFSWASVQSGRLRLLETEEAGCIELEGTPDMVLEIVSRSTVRKENVRLRDLYWRAGIPEYWLVDARGETGHFDILRHSPAGYVATASEDGWLPSAVLGHAFQLTQQMDPLGHSLYTVAMRE